MTFCNFTRRNPTEPWQCTVCGAKAAAKFAAPPIATCRSTIDPWDAIRLLLTDQGLGRLPRCQGCEMLHRIAGHVQCVGRGPSCQWLANWAELLNGSTSCPFWTEPNF